ncbi:MAG: hypothetical protein RSG22_14440 [Comamonas sp.]
MDVKSAISASGGLGPHRRFRTELFGHGKTSGFDSCIPTGAVDAELEQNCWQPDQEFLVMALLFFVSIFIKAHDYASQGISRQVNQKSLLDCLDA